MTTITEPARKIFVLWERGLRGPTLSLIKTRGEPPRLSEREIKHKIGEPIEVHHNFMNYTLSNLARIYPCPTIPEEE